MPKVSVLMPMYNNERFLPFAVESILNQTFTDFELLIIDDGSTDTSVSLARSYADARIRLVENRENLGLTKRLNQGLKLAGGEYIARMDGDDVSRPERLFEQAAYLDQHPEVGLLGSAVQPINEAGQPCGAVYSLPLTDVEVRWQMLLSPAFAHPAVMLRRSVLQENQLVYDETYLSAQDYDMWRRMLMVTRGANLAAPLLYYRRHAEQVSAHHQFAQKSFHDQISLACIETFVPGLGLDFARVQGLLTYMTGKPAQKLQEGRSKNQAALDYAGLYRAFSRRYGRLDQRVLRDRYFHRALRTLVREPRETRWPRAAAKLLMQWMMFKLKKQ